VTVEDHILIFEQATKHDKLLCCSNEAVSFLEGFRIIITGVSFQNSLLMLHLHVCRCLQSFILLNAWMKSTFYMHLRN